MKTISKVEEDHRKMSFGGRQPSLEDDHRWKATFVGRRRWHDKDDSNSNRQGNPPSLELSLGQSASLGWSPPKG